jgi:limonene-1,2-epoxide hydrolase
MTADPTPREGAAGRAGAPTEPIEVVQAFLAALERLDVDAALALTSDDIVYQNVPLPPARGRKAFEQQIRFLERYCTGFEAVVHRSAADGDTVLTERTDALIRDDFRAAFWVDGTFEVVDGRITVWRDRFDWVTVVVAVLAAVPRALLRRLSGSGGSG